MHQKTEIPGIYKTDGYLVNKDNDALQAYKARKLKEVRLEKMEEEFSNIRKDVQEIKELLRGLVK